MYEYDFVEVEFGEQSLKEFIKFKKSNYFDKVKEIINKRANEGWRLVQIVMPQSEKSLVYAPYCYQIIFERKI